MFNVTISFLANQPSCFSVDEKGMNSSHDFKVIPNFKLQVDTSKAVFTPEVRGREIGARA